MAPNAQPLINAIPAGSQRPGDPPLEMVAWPLYSAIALDAAALPREVECFNYLPGMTVSGAGTGATQASLFHTNMTAIRSIAAPKTFTILGISALVPPLVYTTTTALSDATVGTTEENSDQIDDLTLIYQTMHLQLLVGEKVYAEAPLFRFPSNVGIGGLAADSVHANASVVWQRQTAINLEGTAWSYKTGSAPVLWHGQTFSSRVGCPWATNPTIIDNRLLFIILHGLMGREFQ